MAKWNTNTKHSASSINNGNRYEIQDRVTLEQLNAITENSFYASEKVDTVISDAQDVVTQGKAEIENTTSQGKNELNSIVDDAEDLVAKANASIDTVVGTANEALFTVQQVVASKGYYGSNPNLLINGDFKINQRGLSTYNGQNIYTVDRWRLSGTGTVEVRPNGIKFTAGGGWTGIRYYFEKPSQLSNKTFTISAKVKGSVGVWCGFLLNGTNVGGNYNEIKTSQIFKATLTFGELTDNDTLFVRFTTRASGDTLEFEWIKFEIGSVATEFSPRPYAEELALCQRYYLPLMNGASVYNGFIFTETSARISVPVPTTMRLRTPTADFKVVDISQCIIYSNGSQLKPTELIYAGFVDSTQFVINATIQKGTPNHTCAMRLLGSASLDAEIY